MITQVSTHVALDHQTYPASISEKAFILSQKVISRTRWEGGGCGGLYRLFKKYMGIFVTGPYQQKTAMKPLQKVRFPSISVLSYFSHNWSHSIDILGNHLSHQMLDQTFAASPI